MIIFTLHLLRKKDFYTYLSFFYLSIVFANNAMALYCPKAEKPTLTFSMKKKETQFVFSSDETYLTSQATHSPKTSNFDKWKTQGLMSSKFPNYQLQAKISAYSYPDLKKACYFIEQINFDWVFAPTIYIAKEHKKNSCKYNTVIAHERRHVEIDIEILKKYKDAIKNNLEEQTSKPIETGLIDEDPEINLLNRIEENLKPVIDQMIKERNYRQSQIDTVEEYKKMDKICK